ncbi:MAG: sulfatase-like hydrolase/transferase [Candidatus Altiarchaeales archaeon]|nr:sulfatase-like hydrolase/transferase [Candidatus Altiarchaeales archaeon]MBD3417335.1 sulfatase-like hydrolase/transferase [Candidatus Altiarchaeales archaeon]
MEKKLRVRILLACGLAVLLAVFLKLNWGEIGYLMGYADYSCQDCNVILISVDALRADHMGMYGYGRDTTPYLDGFSEKAVLFENAYTPWPKTTPSFASFFTGLHPYKTGIERITLYQWLDEDLVLLPEILKAQGYSTGGLVTNPSAGNMSNLDQGFDFLLTRGYNARGATKYAVKDLKRLDGGRFLYWVHYIDPHTPYSPGGEYQTMYMNDRHYNGSIEVKICPKDKRFSLQLVSGGWPNDYEKQRKGSINSPDVTCTVVSGKTKVLGDYIARYDGEVRKTDDQIGVLLDEIGEMGLMENSIIVIWADHGEDLGEHSSYFQHGRLAYNPSLKVPLMIYHPRLKGRRVKSAVNLIDVFPTLLDMLGLEYPSDGESLKPLMLGKEEDRVVFSSAGYAIDYQKILTDGRWKLIKVPDEIDRQIMTGGEYELYDLKNDPGEARNIYGMPTEGMYLKPLMDRFLEEEYRPYDRDRKVVQYGAETAEDLKSLGYIN